ncbi:phosphatidate cytidylyltransferase [Mucilaginibacter antarcticus]|uniref:Phosphatidate cytidylyltransferase n=1 Tax=Mucilaginibacter antarcticus TaxID=1855725 RepID=A0ABW5XV24_9SPHI
MKKLNLSLLVLAIISLSGCEVIGGIFKAGAFVGILAVVVVIGAVVWILSLFRGRS